VAHAAEGDFGRRQGKSRHVGGRGSCR
jgi:hypothetical protein